MKEYPSSGESREKRLVTPEKGICHFCSPKKGCNFKSKIWKKQKRGDFMGEWQVDERSGRRYRIVGQGCIEHEPDFIGSYGTVPQGMVDKIQRADVTPERQERQESAKTCPFQRGIRGIPCKKDCALRNDNGCGIVTGKGTEGGRCPFSSLECSSDCGLFRDGGCGLLGIR
jgi:hypothetical protein